MTINPGTVDGDKNPARAAGATRGGGELAALAWLGSVLPAAPADEVWFGDDAAVLRLPGADGWLLLATDCLVVGLDADLGLTSLADLGWKAMAVNASDIAAMGGRPLYAVVSVVGLHRDELEELYSGIGEASTDLRCPVVGGDLSAGAQGVVNVAITGWSEGAPVLRSGARPGDAIWVSGPLGAAAAGLRSLQAVRDLHGGRSPVPPGGGGATPDPLLVLAHARPRPALAEGQAARLAGASAMIDVSDGLAADLWKLATSSGVSFELTADDVPVAGGATLEEALGGGDDYVLAFTAGPQADIPGAFAAAGLPAPSRIGACGDGPAPPEPDLLSLSGEMGRANGWEHRM